MREVKKTLSAHGLERAVDFVPGGRTHLAFQQGELDDARTSFEAAKQALGLRLSLLAFSSSQAACRGLHVRFLQVPLLISGVRLLYVFFQNVMNHLRCFSSLSPELSRHFRIDGSRQRTNPGRGSELTSRNLKKASIDRP